MVQATANNVFRVIDFGAVGDGAHDDTPAFEDAIRRIELQGGGRLVVTGSVAQEVVYNIRPINLTSHMTFYVESGARIRAISGAKLWPIIPGLPSYGQGRDYPGPRHTSLIHGEHLTNVTIQGENPVSSTIDGNGKYWWERHRQGNESQITRGSLVEFLYSSQLQIYDIQLANSPFWTVHPYDCDNVHIRNVHVKNPQFTPNTDGFDPDSSRHVVIEDSSYVGGDDCVAIKSGWDCFGIDYGKSSSFIYIRNLTCWSNRIALGSEISGGIENIWGEDIHFPDVASNIVVLKSGKTRGGFIRNVTFRDFSITGKMTGPAINLNMNLYNQERGRNPSCHKNWKPPAQSYFDDLVFENWNGMEADGGGSNKTRFNFQRNTRRGLRNILLKDIYFQDGLWSCSKMKNVTAVNGTITPWPPCKEINIGDGPWFLERWTRLLVPFLPAWSKSLGPFPLSAGVLSGLLFIFFYRARVKKKQLKSHDE